MLVMNEVYEPFAYDCWFDVEVNEPIASNCWFDVETGLAFFSLIESLDSRGNSHDVASILTVMVS